MRMRVPEARAVRNNAAARQKLGGVKQRSSQALKAVQAEASDVYTIAHYTLLVK